MSAPLHIIAEAASLTGMLFCLSQIPDAPTDERLILWCLAGGLCGSFCSLQFKPPKTRQEMAMQLFVNLVFGATLAPLAVDCLSWLTGYPSNIKLALPVAVSLGIGAQESVARLMPKLQAMLERRVISDAEALMDMRRKRREQSQASEDETPNDQG